MKRFAGKKGVELAKKFEGESRRKREKTSRKYISSEDVQRLNGSRKACKVNVQARCEEKLRTDKLKSFSLVLCKRNSNIDSNYRIRKENLCRDFSVYVF